MNKLFKDIRHSDFNAVRATISKNIKAVNEVYTGKAPKKDIGQSPLQVAIKCGEFEIIEFLLKNGADPDFMENPEVVPPHSVCMPVLHDAKLKEKELKALLARDEELDGLFERIYEDNVSGKLSDDRFAKMSRRYEDEQKELAEKIKKLRSEIEKQSSQAMTTDMFISLVRKYTRARKLTPRMLNELVEKIEVYNAEKIDGVWEQRLRIHYNCVGEITIPKMLPLPIPDVTVNTRKGVFVNYIPAEIAG